MSANSRQVAGDHYRREGQQHWDLMAELDANYFQGQITRYTDRHARKAGRVDLEKATHFAQKWSEVRDSLEDREVDTPDRRQSVLEYCRRAGHNGFQTAVFLLALCTPADVAAELAHSLLQDYTERTYPSSPVIVPGTPEDGGQHSRADFDITPGGRVRYLGRDTAYLGRSGAILRNDTDGRVGVRWDGLRYAKDSEDCTWHSVFDLQNDPTHAARMAC